MIRFFFLTILFYAAFFVFVSYSVSKAYFADMTSSSSNTFAAAAQFPTPTNSETPPPTQEIVINEVSPNGSGPEEWVELFNKSNTSLDVSGWKISDENSTDTFPTVASIPAGGYAIIVSNTSTVTVPASSVKIQLASAIGDALNVSSESLGLKKPDNSIVDGVNWGTTTTYFSPAASAPTSIQTLRRVPNGIDTNSATDWTAGASSIGVSN